MGFNQRRGLVCLWSLRELPGTPGVPSFSPPLRQPSQVWGYPVGTTSATAPKTPSLAWAAGALAITTEYRPEPLQSGSGRKRAPKMKQSICTKCSCLKTLHAKITTCHYVPQRHTTFLKSISNEIYKSMLKTAYFIVFVKMKMF